MFTYNLNDEYGQLVKAIKVDDDSLVTVILNYKGQYYRPLHYCLTTKVAECVPVRVYDVESGDGIPRVADSSKSNGSYPKGIA